MSMEHDASAGGTDSPPDTVPTALRDRMRAAHMVPLWESPTAHKNGANGERTFCWPWADTRPVMTETSRVSSPEVVERRVLSLVNPKSRSPQDEATCGAISAALQLLLPGERARPHRHSMNALRFVLEGRGAETIVDGRRCPMEPGDLIVTPAWCWHEHVSNGDGPTIWLDVLDVALHLYLGTEAFQPGPAPAFADVPDDAMFDVSGLIPESVHSGPTHSPKFRYRWSDVLSALAVAPQDADGARRVRYINPATGGPVMALLDCSVVALDAGVATAVLRSSASRICCVVEGAGQSEIAGATIAWKRHDIFTIPAGSAFAHRATGDAKIFVVGNQPVFDRLGLLSERWES